MSVLPTPRRRNETWSFASYNLLTEHVARKARIQVPSPTIHRPLPGGPGRECAGDGLSHPGWHPLLHAYLGAWAPAGSSSRSHPGDLGVWSAFAACHDRQMGPINRGMRRQEGRAKVDGSTTFTADLDLPGLLHVQLVLSHLPSARVRSVDTSAARSAPGVVDVVTGADLPQVEASGPDKPLAIDRVFYSGPPVAAVIAETQTAAADAAALIVVDLEELPVVAGPEQAMKDDAPEVLESDAEGSEGDASMHGAATESESEPVERPRNVSSVASYKRGDVESGLATADAIVKATYGLARVHHSFIEPHVSVVRPEPGGGVTIWAPTQGPFAVRDEIAKVIDAAPHEVRVISMPVGGGFGGKVMLLETLLVLLARMVRRPVRLALTRQQEFLLGHPAPAARFDLELGAKRDGTLVALRARYDYDNGASGGWHAGITGSFLGGTYRIPNFEITGSEVATNKTPADAYRAPGAPQAYFALESAMDELAIELGIDPIELRLHNASREGDLNADEEPWPRIAMVECLEAARRHPVYTAPAGPGEGVGIALGCWGGARSPAAAGCRGEPDGTVSILIGSPDISGSSTGLAMIAAEAFGIAPEKVRVTVGDTSYAPQGPMAAGSQVTYSVGGAVYEAALEARRQLLEIATDELEAAPEDLEIVDGHVAGKGVPDRFVEITRLVAMSTEFMGRHRPI